MTYEIIISDPWETMRPKFLVKGIGIVFGPDLPYWQSQDYLVEIVEPFEVNNELVQYLTIGPRYEGTTIEDIQKKECIVGIGKVEPNKTLVVGQRYSPNDVVYWTIGSIKPIGA